MLGRIDSLEQFRLRVFADIGDDNGIEEKRDDGENYLVFWFLMVDFMQSAGEHVCVGGHFLVLGSM